MTKTKCILLGTIAGITLLVAVDRGANAEIPVIDTAALGEWVSQLANDATAYALQVEKYEKQISQYTTQLQQYAQETQLFENFYHNPSLGAALGVLMGAGLGNQMPVSPYAILSLVNGLQSMGNGGFNGGAIGGILGSLNGLANSAYTTAHIYTPTDGTWASQQLIARGAGIAGEQGATQGAYADLRTHQAALQPLRDNLLGATDTKSVLDATGQIQVETAWNVNEAAQLQAVSATYQAQKDSIVQRDNERLDQDIEGFLASSPTPNP
jgi:conjugal transfer/entry exclusion protein